MVGLDWRTATRWTRTTADLLDAHDAHPKKSPEAVASSQVLINSPASRPAEKCLPSAWLPLLASWIVDRGSRGLPRGQTSESCPQDL